MKDTEQLELEYLRIKNERNLHLIDEKRAHKAVIACQEKMKQLKRDIEEFEKDNLNEKLLDCVDFISRYCRGQETCYHCLFYDENGSTRCALRNAMNPAIWNDKLER